MADEHIRLEWARSPGPFGGGWVSHVPGLLHGHIPGNVMVVIDPRPDYCDRGRWQVDVSGAVNVDGADMFPRLYFDLERAKAEMEDWVNARSECQAAARKAREASVVNVEIRRLSNLCFEVWLPKGANPGAFVGNGPTVAAALRGALMAAARNEDSRGSPYVVRGATELLSAMDQQEPTGEPSSPGEKVLDMLRWSGPWTLEVTAPGSQNAYATAVLRDGGSFSVTITGSGGPEPAWAYQHPARLGEAMLAALSVKPKGKR